MIDVYVDAETTYDEKAGHSLKCQTTREYIKDPRTQELGYAVWVEGAGALSLTPVQMRELADALPWDKVRLVAHNSQFDHALLYDRMGVSPAQLGCTMLKARYAIAQGRLSPDQRTSLASLAPLVGMEKADHYAGIRAGDRGAAAAQALTDLKICMELDRALPPLPPLEADLVDLNIRMSTQPVLALDTDLLMDLTTDPEPDDPEYQDFKVRRELSEAFRKKEVFAEALRSIGVEPHVKPGKKGPIYAFAKTDDFMQELLESGEEDVQLLAELRLYGASTQLRTRAQTFLRVGQPLPMPQTYYGTVTGRGAATEGEDMNVLNLKRGGDLRRSIMAPEGYKLVVVDSAAVEVRTTAWLAQCETLLEAFRAQDAAQNKAQKTERDVYRRFAAEHLYGIDVSSVTDDQRQIGKAAVLALGFGQRSAGFMRHCKRNKVKGMNDALAEFVVMAYDRAYPPVSALRLRLEREALENGYCQLPSGRQIHYPGMERGDWELQADGRNVWTQDPRGRKKSWLRPLIFSRRKVRERVNFWHGGATENAASGMARDVVMTQIVDLRRRWWVAHTCYDEAVLVVPADQAEEARQDAQRAFSIAPEWAEGLPVRGEAKICDRYSEK